MCHPDRQEKREPAGSKPVSLDCLLRKPASLDAGSSQKHVGTFGQTDEEMQILDALEHAESEDAEEDELEDVMYDIEDSFEDEETGDTGFGAVLAVIMRRETGINFKFYAAENDLGTPPAILWVPMYPWMLNEKERGITESDLYDLCRKYMDELEIFCDPEEMELEYYS